MVMFNQDTMAFFGLWSLVFGTRRLRARVGKHQYSPLSSYVLVFRVAVLEIAIQREQTMMTAPSRAWPRHSNSRDMTLCLPQHFMNT
jgi:hypothetical protein